MLELSGYMAAAVKRPLPREVAEKTKHHIIDSLAAMVSGARLPPGKIAASFVKREGGVEQACVAGTRIVTSAGNAALGAIEFHLAGHSTHSFGALFGAAAAAGSMARLDACGILFRTV